jgi:hypothetical protein
VSRCHRASLPFLRSRAIAPLPSIFQASGQLTFSAEQSYSTTSVNLPIIGPAYLFCRAELAYIHLFRQSSGQLTFSAKQSYHLFRQSSNHRASLPFLRSRASTTSVNLPIIGPAYLFCGEELVPLRQSSNRRTMTYICSLQANAENRL